jgi:hypothetical protein
MVPGSILPIDRWGLQMGGTMRVTAQQIAANAAVPGTNFIITQKILRLTLTTAQASLGATDYLLYQQSVEGPQLRELIGDVHSVSILARSSVANLKFGLTLQDTAASTHVLVKLCSLGAANIWTLITLPNLPLWTASGTFTLTPGLAGYYPGIVLAAGTTYTIPANDIWQTSAAFGAVGQSNFANNSVNSTFDLAFIQHEPGALCTTPIDKPFSQNYDECLRYYCKTYNYTEAIGTADFNGLNGSFYAEQATFADGWAPFPKRMAKIPVFVNLYNPSNGALSSAYSLTTGAAAPVTAQYINDASFFRLQGTTVVGNCYGVHYFADICW